MSPIFAELGWTDDREMRRFVHAPSFLMGVLKDKLVFGLQLAAAAEGMQGWGTLADEETRARAVTELLTTCIETANAECKAIAAREGIPVRDLYDAMRVAAQGGKPVTVGLGCRAVVAARAGLPAPVQGAAPSHALMAALQGPIGEAVMREMGLLPGVPEITVVEVRASIE